jgi:hypothetical protein
MLRFVQLSFGADPVHRCSGDRSRLRGVPIGALGRSPVQVMSTATASPIPSLACASAANRLVRLAKRWWTPPLSSGYLPGILRGLGLRRGW